MAQLLLLLLLLLKLELLLDSEGLTPADHATLLERVSALMLEFAEDPDSPDSPDDPRGKLKRRRVQGDSDDERIH